MRVMGIDPGAKSIAVAIMEADGTLVSAWYSKGDSVNIVRRGSVMYDTFTTADLVVIEVPQIYQRSKGDPNDLIDVARMAGAMEYVARNRPDGRPARIEAVRPFQWKGNLPKEVHHKRILAELSKDSLGVLEGSFKTIPKSLRHNVMDAVGLAMYGVKKCR